jgi:hypothetical protein
MVHADNDAMGAAFRTFSGVYSIVLGVRNRRYAKARNVLCRWRGNKCSVTTASDAASRFFVNNPSTVLRKVTSLNLATTCLIAFYPKPVVPLNSAVNEAEFSFIGTLQSVSLISSDRRLRNKIRRLDKKLNSRSILNIFFAYLSQFKAHLAFQFNAT